MTEALELVAELVARNVSLSLDGGRLQCHAPRGALTAELRERIAAHKPQIVALIERSRDRLGAGAADQRALTGEVLLGPMQAWFFAQAFPAMQHWNHGVVVELARPLGEDDVRRVVLALIHHHDALRLAFHRVDGRWVQRYLPPVERPPVERHDLTRLAGPDADAAMRALCERAQASLDLERGELVRGLVFDRDARQELVLAIHHLAVDGVSWRILLEDLEALIGQVHDGAPLQLPPKTAAYRDWTAWLAGRPAEPSPDGPDAEDPAWPVDFPGGRDRNDVASEDAVTLRLPAELTGRLLGEANAPYKSHAIELLVAAFGVACARWTGRPRSVIGLESHGRDDVPDGMDVSRTVGWFTRIQPVALDVDPEAPLAAIIKSTKQQLRRTTAAHAPGAPRVPAVVFNYLGRAAGRPRGAADVAGYRFDDPRIGALRDPRQHRSELVAVNSGVAGDQLVVELRYSKHRHARATIEALGASFTGALRAIVDHCAAIGYGGRVPSDFPLVTVRQDQIDALERAHGGVDALWPMTPSQRGLLYGSLAASGGPSPFIEQSIFALHGRVDVDRLRAAWRQVTAAHRILHARIELLDDEPVLVIPPPAAAPAGPGDAFEVHDWTPGPGATPRTLDDVRAFAAGVKARGFDLRRSAACRLDLIVLGGDEWAVIWTFHHLILDGWSNARVMRDWFDACRTGRVEAAASDFAAYLGWLARQDRPRAIAHWQAYLDGFARPNAIGRVVRRDAPVAPSPGRITLRISAAATQAVTARCRQAHVALSSAVHAAWGLVVAALSGDDDVVWGKTLAGRPPELLGSDRIAGLLITTVPVRMQIDRATPFWDGVGQLQLREAGAIAHSFLSTGEIQRGAGGGLRGPLFDTLVVFENYPRTAGSSFALGASATARIVAQAGGDTPYLLTLLADVDRDALVVELCHDAARISAEQVGRVAHHLERVLDAIARGEDRIAALLAAVDTAVPLVIHAPADVPARAHRDPIEAALVRICAEVLQIAEVDPRRNLFELGAHSLALTALVERLDAELGWRVPITDLFAYPTVERLAAHLRARSADGEDRAARPAPVPVPAIEPGRAAPDRGRSRDVAVIGMACRFPRASTPAALWRNLAEGRDCIEHFTEDELRAAGVAPEDYRAPDYVPAKGMIDGVELFDAEHFQYTPYEAEVIDPQQRVFLTTTHEALEDAGYPARGTAGRVGIYGGSGVNLYFLLHLLDNPAVRVDPFQVQASNLLDYLCTRVAYKLDLRGPAVTIQTACSTSLVAMHYALDALRKDEVDLAICGAVSIGGGFERAGVPRGLTLSPDGRCRSFDAGASGTVLSQGCGVVVLKRLDRAVADRDHIYAVVKGSAVNNDGNLKAGFTTPSVHGQAEVIAAAQTDAGVTAASISYVEAHATATPLGDPIEVAALTRAFAGSPRTARCALGAVKSNLGHLDAASGMAGLIKTVLCLRHAKLVPSLHFREPNPRLELAASPFHVVTALEDWTPAAGAPRRAGISSFGVGGSNAHVIVEEYVADRAARPVAPGPYVVPVSARTAEQLDAYARRLLAFLDEAADEAAPDAPALADVAYTFQVGREPMAHRVALCARSCDELAHQLRQLVAGAPHIAGVVRGRASDAPGAAAPPAADDRDAEVEAAARCWVAGGEVDWSRLWRGAPGARIPLPTYPFASVRHWVPRIRSLHGRAGVRTSAPDRAAPPAPTHAPGLGDDLEQTVVRVLAETLKVPGDRFETELSLLDLGADSIVLLQVLDDLEQATGVRLSPGDFVAPPSARMIVQEIAERHGDTWRAHRRTTARPEPPEPVDGAAGRRAPDLAALADQILAGALTFEHALTAVLG